MHFVRLFIVAALSAITLAQGSQKVRIMYMGDSITEITCWRALVYDMIYAAGLANNVTFVGSQTTNTQNCKAKNPGFDLHHEGHSGWRGVDIANNYLTGWLASSKPDIVNFMLGTNDVTASSSTSTIMAAYTKMVKEMRDSNANMSIIVDKVIPLSFNNNPINSINAAIPSWAEDLNSTSSPIMIADCSTQAGFTTAMLRDGVHPNAQGDQVMAANIGPLVVQLIKQKLGIAN